MFATTRILLVTALAFGFASNARADDKKPEKPKPAADPGKPIVIQIDASKLPPDVLKQLLQLAEKPAGDPGKPGAKPGFKPGTKPEGDKGAKPGERPGGERFAKPGEKPGDKGVKPGEKGVKPGIKPGEKPGSKPGSQDEIIQRLEKLSLQIEQLRKSIEK